jgi:hypothetical protein
MFSDHSTIFLFMFPELEPPHTYPPFIAAFPYVQMHREVQLSALKSSMACGDKHLSGRSGHLGIWVTATALRLGVFCLEH